MTYNQSHLAENYYKRASIRWTEKNVNKLKIYLWINTIKTNQCCSKKNDNFKTFRVTSKV